MYENPRKESDESEGIVALIRETADGFGHLLGEHIKLARLELIADVQRSGRQVGLIALLVPFIFLGYGLACVGLAMLLSRWLGHAGAMFAVGGVHIVGGATAIALALRRLRRVRTLHDTAVELNRSVTALTAIAVSNGSPPARRD